MPGRVCWTVLGAATLAAMNLAAQVRSDSASVDSVALVPGPRYGAGWLQRWLLGTNYRDLWTQPITAERLDLGRFAGGLRPECRAGGLETALLELRGADQRRYLFQSADKDPTSAPLPARLRRTSGADVLRDQVSSRHPAGGLVVAPLLRAAGVLHVEPRLGIMPDGAELGEFRQVFAGMLGTVEERPVHGFAGSERVEDTEQLWRRLDTSPADRVDARACLTARLIDILVGDGGRHCDRWSWAGYRSEPGLVWKPIPRDRDQAFARLEGVVASAARRYLPQLVSFGPSYPDMYGLTWSARALDRRFLVELDKAAWDSVARAVQGRLTDRVLETAVGRLPREMHQRSGAELLESLISRRDRLGDAADRFYPLVAEYADVRATDQDDWAEVDRLDQRRVRVRIAAAEAWSRPYFERTFTLGETKEIRLDLAGGDDRAVFPPNSRISLGPFLAFAETQLGRGGLVDSLRPYGAEGFVEVGAAARVEVDTRDRALVPRRGVHLLAAGRLVPQWLDATEPYGFVSGEATTYLSAGDPARVTLALRAGGKRVWGRYPYFAAAYVGGATTLRGHDEQRFAGDAVVYGNGELRVFLTRFSVVLPGELGVLGLGDVGRAYLASERSTRWHSAVGGGVWLAFIERGSAVTLTVARSPERWAYYGGWGSCSEREA